MASACRSPRQKATPTPSFVCMVSHTVVEPSFPIVSVKLDVGYPSRDNDWELTLPPSKVSVSLTDFFAPSPEEGVNSTDHFVPFSSAAALASLAAFSAFAAVSFGLGLLSFA